MEERIVNIPLNFVEIEDGGYHLFVKAEVNGKEAFLLVDTGASKTVFDKDKIKQLLDIDNEEHEFELSPHKSTGLGTNSMDSHLVSDLHIRLGDINIIDFQSVVLPMSHVNEAYQLLGYREIDGVLGCDILNEYSAVIYFKKKLLKLSKPKSKRRRTR